MDRVEHFFVETNGVRLHCVGEGRGKLVLLLHGFPEFWYSWRHQLPVLGKYFRAVAPDLRGYNESDRPEGEENYRLEILVEDVVGLVEKLGDGRGMVVGHDWGGVIAWAFASLHPDLTEKLVIMNAPHPSVMAERISSPEQSRRSWYISFFRKEREPEKFLEAENYAVLKEVLRSTAIKPAFKEEDLEKFVEAWSKPGALRAGINYYRANGPEGQARKLPKVKVPTLVIWGKEDAFLSLEVSRADEYVEAPYEVVYLENCGHWVQNEEPELVNRLLLEFLGA
ncbi:MAG: alpha/beta hydrolase [Hadesarchaea archaeon]|nr:MAG: alpha/beta hydrolase [Hadesarchaea archaeon]TDA33354.1 MAG: alpha/beta hydrolase [Hadesarchaea archaeon]